MFRRTAVAATAGFVSGAVLGILTLAAAAPRVIEAGLGIPAHDDGLLEAAFTVTQAGAYLFVLVAGAVGGAILAMIAYAVSTQTDPAGSRYPLGPVAAFGAAVGAPIAFAAARAAMGLAADISAKQIVLPVFRAGLVAVAAGAVTGLLVAVAVERLSRPEAIGMTGAAAPRSARAFARDAVAAVGLPVLGVAAAAAAAFGLSRVLLDAEGSTALVVFGGVAALVLGGAAVLASRPPRQR